jgi:hypothetical protein
MQNGVTTEEQADGDCEQGKGSACFSFFYFLWRFVFRRRFLPLFIHTNKNLPSVLGLHTSNPTSNNGF